MEKRFPKRLKHEPLIEAAWTLHFSLREADNLLLLPGHLHAGLQAEFPVVERGPDLPLFAYQALPPLGDLPLLQMRDKEGRWLLDITAKTLVLRNRRPYAGWARFSDRGKNLIQRMRQLPFLCSIHKGSLRYIDFFYPELLNTKNLDSTIPSAILNLRLYLDEISATDELLHLRMKKQEEDFDIYITVMYPVQLLVQESERSGLLLDIETIFTLSAEAKEEGLMKRWEKAHQVGHRVFFSLLHPEVLQKLGPEYD